MVCRPLRATPPTLHRVPDDIKLMDRDVRSGTPEGIPQVGLHVHALPGGR